MQECESANSAHQVFSLTSKRLASTMKNEYDGIPVDIILREASTALQAAQQHALELSEVGLTDNELNRMRVLITRVAAHSYTSLWSNVNVSAEVRELKIARDIILRAAEMRFGSAHEVLIEFHADKNPLQ